MPDASPGRPSPTWTALLTAGGDGVYLAQDGGLRWQGLGTTLGDRPPVAAALSPNFLESRTVYALTIGGQLWKWEPAD